MKSREQQSASELALFISFLSTFYDKMTEKHSRKNVLRRQWLTLKHQMQALEGGNIHSDCPASQL